SFVIKVATDAVGIGDNPREYINQQYYKPFVTKVFEVSPCGTVGVFERVVPITSREEFLSVAPFVYDVILNWFVGEYVCDDIGTEFFLNWGIRNGFGPVLLDFPYVYKLDGNKLYCNRPNDDGTICNSVIDYDDGFNHLRCTKCGAEYKALELQKAIETNSIISRGGRSRMKVGFKYGDDVTVNAKDTEQYMDTAPKLVPNKKDRKKPSKIGSLKVTAKVAGRTIVNNDAETKKDDDKIETNLKVKGTNAVNNETEKEPETTINNTSTTNEQNTTNNDQLVVPNYIMYDAKITNTSELDGDEENKIKCLVLTDPTDGKFAKFKFGDSFDHIIMPTIDGLLLSEISIVRRETLAKLEESIEMYKAENEMLRQELSKFDTEESGDENDTDTEEVLEGEVKVDTKGRKRDEKGRFIKDESQEEEQSEMNFDTSSPLLDHDDETGIPVGATPPKNNSGRSKRYDPEFYQGGNKESKEAGGKKKKK
ncbi:MAG: hypothetical protein NC310_09025, partial [Roseburia sp.]|nr:hypothetical protein [Roseburia sp.]